MLALLVQHSWTLYHCFQTAKKISESLKDNREEHVDDLVTLDSKDQADEDVDDIPPDLYEQAYYR